MTTAKLTRRQALEAAGAGAAALALSALADAANAPQRKDAFVLPRLPYAYDALAPHIDEQTMHLHHDRHHQAYVDGLNAAVAGHPDLQKQPVEELLRNISQVPEGIRQKVINHGGGHANHTLFWEVMGPKGGGHPTGALAQVLGGVWPDFATFQKQFKQAALDRFGSGWAWLVLSKGKLEIISTANQDSPLMSGRTPLLGLDVWEHAYYLGYQNKRPAYVDAWWNVVNWVNVAERYATAARG